MTGSLEEAEDTRTVAVVTGTRAEYGLLKSSMLAIQETASLDLQVIATGMHLSETYGYTLDEIREDGFEIAATPEMLIDGNSGASMAKSLGTGVLGFVDAFQILEPNCVLVLGDRDEPLAATLAAAHMDIPVAHIHGGDAARGATIDESIRHALTKFAHLHFPASERSAERIRKLGEQDWRIHLVGAPGLDPVLAGEYASSVEVAEVCDIVIDEPILVVLQHPLTRGKANVREQMHATLDAVSSFNGQVVCIYPNADAGGRSIIDVIESRADELGIQRFKSLPHRQFLGLLDVADVLVGNSSAGIIEAPNFNLPVIDIGPRQEGRERADNTISVEYDSDAIRTAIQRAMDPEFRDRAARCSNPYDHGGAGPAIAEALASITLDNELLQKELTY